MIKEIFDEIASINYNVLSVTLISFFYFIEKVFNTGHKFDKKGLHIVNNLPLFVLFWIISFGVANVQVGVYNFFNTNHIGLFHLIHLPYVLQIVIGVAMLDMGTYWIHWLSHKIPFLWRFHRVHHSDMHMDSSTYFRFHPFEFSFAIGNIIVGGLLGLDLTILTVYFLVVLPFVIIEHVNIEFPKWIDLSIGKIFTTPNMHKVHHHKDQEFTDSNYADIFII